MPLEQDIIDFLKEKGAVKVGFANKETLAGGPPSIDLDYRMEGAKSVISFALPLNRDYIRPFLAKEARTKKRPSPWEEESLPMHIPGGYENITMPDGEIRVYPPDEAAKKFEQMPADHKENYI